MNKSGNEAREEAKMERSNITDRGKNQFRDHEVRKACLRSSEEASTARAD